MQNKPTDELLKILENCSMETAISLGIQTDDAEGLTFCNYLAACQNHHGIELAEIAQSAQIHRTYIYQIADGRRNPGRDKVIAISLAGGFSLDETQRLLKLSGNGSLYPKTSRDAILIKALYQHLSVMDVNLILEKQALRSL